MMNMNTLILAAAATLLSAPLLVFAEDNVAEQAREIVRRHLVIDTHIDVPYRIHDHWEDVTRATEGGDFDLPRARVGGLDVSFMSIYTPAEMEASGGAYQLANFLIDSVEAMVARAPDKLMMASTPSEAEAAVAAGKMALALGMENGTPIDGQLDRLRFFRDRGISYVTLAHSLSNHISDSSYDDNRQWEGLSEFGREAVREMNRLGIMVDVSHITDDAFYQVLEVSSVPVIASHSSARKFTPGFERNMSDEMIVALAKNGGVVQINFGSSFLTSQANAWSTKFWAERAAYAEENGFAEGGEEMALFSKNYRKENPLPYANLDHVLDHFDHVVRLAGIEHVGIGSDYDGVGDSLPEGLKDVSAYPNLVAGLIGRGYSEADIARILGGNLMRVWREAVTFAAAR